MAAPTSCPSPTLLRYALLSSSIPSRLPLQLLPRLARGPITQFYRLSDRKLALGSQLLQRLLLCETHKDLDPNITLQSVTLWKDPESGRPGYLLPECATEPRIIDYNVSHHSGLVVLAARLPPPSTFIPGSPKPRRIGVDVVPTTLPQRAFSSEEFLDSYTSPSSGVFTPQEIADINSQPTWPLRVRMFYMHWALKEAYVKAIGTGLVTDLTQIEFRNLKLFDLDRSAGKRYTDAKLYLSGVEQPEWYLEVDVFEGVDEGEPDENGICYIAIATEREGLSDEDLRGKWKVVDMERDIGKWDATRR
ncbi:hypothetical protein BGX38DRAFT_1193427 [Terfezia claveryi]|nr:hypothetical protein BGX38DRAFT_1193427 [Terfezia claveryi]